MIHLICQQIPDRTKNQNATEDCFNHRLIVTGSDSVPPEVKMDVNIRREDQGGWCNYATTNAADARQRFSFIKMISDDTNVFILLLHFTWNPVWEA